MKETKSDTKVANNLDIIGYSLSCAKEILDKDKIKISCIKVVSPPKLGSLEYDDTYRVVRIEFTKEAEIELLLCRPLS